MRILLLLFIAGRLLFMTQCDKGECIGQSILDFNDIPRIASLTPLDTIFTQGSIINFSVTVPSTNTYFGDPVNMLEESGDSLASLVLYNDYFEGNTYNFIKGSQQEGPFSEVFFMPYNADTQNYEFEMEITLDQVGDYSIPSQADIEIGLGDCPDFFVTTFFEGVEGNVIDFRVVE